MGTANKKIVIIGGGISGLSAAFYLQKLCKEQEMPIDITLVERNKRLGGQIRTLHRDGHLIEQGPDSFLGRKLAVINLIKELGLEGDLTATNPKAKQSFIMNRGKLHPMPPGLMLGIPTKITPMMKTKLLTPIGKLRAALDLILPKNRQAADESLGNFIERRLGREVLDNITEPLLGGIYAGDARALSLLSTFPEFKRLEQKHRSLILGMLARRKQPVERKNEDVPEIVNKSMFLTLKGGLTTLISRLTESLASVTMLTGHGVAQLSKVEGGYSIMLDHGVTLQADGVILALPAFESAKLLRNVQEAGWLGRMHYTSVANVALAYNQEDIGDPLEGSGFVVPRKEGRLITACTWTSSKWMHAAPAGHVLLRTYAGRADAEAWTRLSDEALIDGIRADLKDIMGITAKPIFYEITKCNRAMPQYSVGHSERLSRLRTRLQAQMPGLMLCGSAYEGVGIPDCIQQGKAAAEQTAAVLLES